MTSTASEIKIVIGIPTFKRPQGLRRLLDSLAVTQAPFIPHIVIADNEGEGGAGLAVAAQVTDEGYPFPITALPVPERGISQARNALLHQAFKILGADYLAMVDDDERVEPDWITQLVSMQQKTQADVVGGCVMAEFEHPPHSWVLGLNVYYMCRQQDGPAEMIWGAGNCLLHKNVAMHISLPVLFDPSFSLTGGEDDEYFYRLKSYGATFAYSGAAITHEYFGAARVTKFWALKRSFRIGTSYARIAKMNDLSTSRMWLGEILKILSITVKALLFYIFFFFSPARRMRELSLLARQAGKIAGFLGRYGQEYGRIHGQ